jgi:hypothetical protein
MPAKDQVPHTHAVRWVKNRYGGTVFASMTGQDMRAFNAAMFAIDLWCCSDADGKRGAVAALKVLVGAMLPHNRRLVRAAIPSIADWGHEAELWALVAPGDTSAPLVALRRAER